LHHQFLASALSFAVDPQGVRRVVFGVGRGLLAVKDEIRRNVDERPHILGAHGGQAAGSLGVDGKGFHRLILGAVHGGVSGAVDNAVHPQRPHAAELVHRGGVA